VSSTIVLLPVIVHPLQEWHCTLRGPAGTEFEGGLYHFRILLPAEYPFRPPSLMMLTPNGRFELNTKASAVLRLTTNC
jgi:ubiquitin-conjugating enzyme E2 J1